VFRGLSDRSPDKSEKSDASFNSLLSTSSSSSCALQRSAESGPSGFQSKSWSKWSTPSSKLFDSSSTHVNHVLLQVSTISVGVVVITAVFYIPVRSNSTPQDTRTWRNSNNLSFDSPVFLFRFSCEQKSTAVFSRRNGYLWLTSRSRENHAYFWLEASLWHRPSYLGPFLAHVMHTIHDKFRYFYTACV